MPLPKRVELHFTGRSGNGVGVRAPVTSRGTVPTTLGNSSRYVLKSRSGLPDLLGPEYNGIPLQNFGCSAIDPAAAWPPTFSQKLQLHSLGIPDMSLYSIRTLLAFSCVFLFVLPNFVIPNLAEAQFVRRFAGGGLQVNAPFVRVNIGGGGGVSVRAPYTAVDTFRRGTLWRRRLAVQPQPYLAPSSVISPQNPTAQKPTPTPAQRPTLADVDALPYPTVNQLATMDEAALVETLREMMGRLNYRLSLLNTGEGWQRYLILNREDLGSPGSAPSQANISKIQQVLPHFQGVENNPEFVKIFSLPSFVAAHGALKEVNRRAGISPESFSKDAIVTGGQTDGSIINDPSDKVATPVEQPHELLPTPEPAASRGERSILKRK